MRIYDGKSVFGGIAIGRIHVYKKGEQQVSRRRIEDADVELCRYEEAKAEAIRQLAELHDKALREIGEANAAIFEMHQIMLDDEDYNGTVENIVRSQMVNAEYAVATTGDNFSQMFAAMEDDYMRERAADVKDISERLIAALTRVKSYLDYGAFTPIQVAATAALNGDGTDIEEVRDVYHKRRDVMVDAFGRAGWDIPAPAATMFAWAPIPEPFKHLGSLEFSKLLIEHADVAVAPGIGFGEHGDDYVRLALVENEHRIRQAARNIKKFLATVAKQPNNVVPLAAHR